MQNIQAARYIFLACIFIVPTAQAHDPSEHIAKVEKPKCEAMKNMDHSKMDANDPVTQAIMKKCMSEEPAENQHTEAAAENAADGTDKIETEKPASGHGH